jgi:hypothetical protein
MRLFIPLSFLLVFSFVIIYSCTKDKGRNPSLAYTNFGLRDSCRNAAAFVYYKNDPNTVYSGTNGPHGAFKLKFNHKAFAQLTDAGKLPIGGIFSDGSMIVKEILSGTNIKEYAVMYKLSGSWIWAEFTPDLKSIIHSVDSEHSVCTGCHSQPGNRDLVATFSYH